MRRGEWGVAGKGRGRSQTAARNLIFHGASSTIKNAAAWSPAPK